MGSAQAEHALVTMMVASLDRTAKARRWREEKIHETKVALLVEVTDRGGRFSAGLDDVGWGYTIDSLWRKADVPKCSGEKG